MATATAEIDLQTYCHKFGGTRYELSYPFVVDQMRYATDGRICIRVAAPGEPNTEGSFPPVKDLPWADVPESELWQWPVATYVWSEQQEGPTDEDGETAYVWLPSVAGQPVANRDIASAYHYRISLLPNPRFSPDGTDEACMYFRFDGGEGCIMPRRKRKLEID